MLRGIVNTPTVHLKLIQTRSEDNEKMYQIHAVFQTAYAGADGDSDDIKWL